MILYCKLQGEYDSVLPERGLDTEPAKSPNRVIMKVNMPDQFKNDVDSLCKFIGIESLEAGMVIRMTLSEAKDIMPRKRVCLDSYSSLVNFLKESMAVELSINSNKSKNYGRYKSN